MEKFIKIGSTRIKKTNIKKYGVYTKSKRYDRKSPSFFKSPMKFLNVWNNPYEGKNIRYLRIETFQNEIFDFDEDEFNINPALKELDSTL